ncbi:N-acetylglucosamine-6-phosphate deacetylase [Alloscardovia macacae]|uniref:N-acetylglucosamine-6-phosphate deacetylase n=2 Tax=Alloscardovia macacae TaxID=1160091 RepID=A0A261F6Y8_9BIFI|nr:N-acetylglucosamine-6-phosphate deacetylase [Alloscardovia macacae]OZG54793.1 N-acetylglucosamine-6-phosphate deacetylase [Alloscardovia macacae]
MSVLIQKVPDSLDERAKIAARIDDAMRGAAQAGMAQPDSAQTNPVQVGTGRITIFEHARVVDALGDERDAWLILRDGVIIVRGVGDVLLEAIKDELISEVGVSARDMRVLDVKGAIVCPGYIDIHSHGGWGSAFDDGPEAISMARAFHMLHGTTRNVLSLITNPWENLLENVRVAAGVTKQREDVLGLHLEGPFLAVKRKGAHDEQCLLDPTPERVEQLLDAADGTLQQITIAPELPHGMSAIEQFARAGVHPAVGHCDADYDQARAGFEHGASIMTHMFNAMNGISHRAPGPIPAATQNDGVTVELIADGFHVQVPVLRSAVQMTQHRLALVTDAMAAAGCPDGAYLLGNLEVNVVDGHARLVSNGAIAGSTLNLEEAVQRMVLEVGMSVRDAIEAATFTPARALGLDRPNAVTSAPVGLLRQGFAADVLVLHPATLEVQEVWCAGVQIGE